MQYVATARRKLSGRIYEPGEPVPESVIADANGSRRLVALGIVAAVPDAPRPAAPAKAFDPTRHSVKEVLSHLDAHPEEAEAIRAAEEAGYARKGVLGPIDEKLAAQEGGGNTSGDGGAAGSGTGAPDPDASGEGAPSPTE